MIHALPRDFYLRDTIVVAKDLLGKYLYRRVNDHFQIGKIVEVEAYLGPHDKAAHSCKGLTPRTKVMFGPPGFAYVYLIYGMYHCLNVVTEPAGQASAVLIRALEPIANIDMKTSGPGLLCKALAIDKAFNGHDFLSEDFFITEGQGPRIVMVKRPRIGVAYAMSWAKRLLRFYIKGNPYISKP